MDKSSKLEKYLRQIKRNIESLRSEGYTLNEKAVARITNYKLTGDRYSDMAVMRWAKYYTSKRNVQKLITVDKVKIDRINVKSPKEKTTKKKKPTVKKPRKKPKYKYKGYSWKEYKQTDWYKNSQDTLAIKNLLKSLNKLEEDPSGSQLSIFLKNWILNNSREALLDKIDILYATNLGFIEELYGSGIMYTGVVNYGIYEVFFGTSNLDEIIETINSYPKKYKVDNKDIKKELRKVTKINQPYRGYDFWLKHLSVPDVKGIKPFKFEGSNCKGYKTFLRM